MQAKYINTENCTMLGLFI